MKKIIESANTVFKKADQGFLVIKSRYGDLSEGEIHTEDFVSVYVRENSAVII
jgi:hypothetical protein